MLPHTKGITFTLLLSSHSCSSCFSIPVQSLCPEQAYASRVNLMRGLWSVSWSRCLMKLLSSDLFVIKNHFPTSWLLWDSNPHPSDLTPKTWATAAPDSYSCLLHFGNQLLFINFSVDSNTNANIIRFNFLLLDFFGLITSWEAGLGYYQQFFFWDLRPSGCLGIFLESKMFADMVGFPLFVPLFCPTIISLGRFGPISLWVRYGNNIIAE